ncbi:restriction endonuclease subunit S [Nostocoides veronense]|uniref:Type I restriction modification DNA specificity domain-containing protein n=1 Tax=Nostocoides veronense TaxID=330836 RepID=A0ABN2LLC2_9MICO
MTTVALGEVALINPRAERPGPNEDVAFVGMADLSAESGVAGPGVLRPFHEVSKGYTVFRDEDLLVAKITPCFENGKTGQAKLRRPIGVGSTEFHVVRPNPGQLDSRFALHFLRQGWIRRAGELRMTGSAGQRRVPAAFLTELEVPLAPIEEQRRIAAILDQASELNCTSSSALAATGALGMRAFERAASISTRIVRLADVADFYGGSSLPRGEVFTDQPGGYFLLKVSDMNRPGNEIELKTAASWSASPGSRASTCPAGSVVIPKRGGAIGTNKKRRTTRASILDPNLMAISPRIDAISPAFLFAWFQQFDLSTISSGSSVPQLNKQDLAPLKLPLPSSKEQSKFDLVAAHVEEQQRRLEVRRNSLLRLFESLQARAFSGRL